MENESPLRGRFCTRCNGRGSVPGLLPQQEFECSQCNWVGFVGLTSKQVRQAEIDEMEKPCPPTKN